MKSPGPDSLDETDFAPRGPAEGVLSGVRILILDDSEDATDMLGRLFQLDGADVTAANNGEEALELARNLEFDVILSDISMPEMNGYEFLQALRALPTQRDVPVVALTGFAEIEDVERVNQEGFSHHISKPIDVERVVQLLINFTRKRAAATGQP